VLLKCDFLIDLGENNTKYSDLWDKIKSAK